VDAYTITYDGLNRVDKVQERNGGVTGTVRKTTSFTYDPNGNPATRGHDNATATYEYDLRDLVSKITDKKTASDPSPKVTTYTYTPRAQRDIETKGNGNTVDYDYHLDGKLQHQIEKKPNGTVVSEHTLSQDVAPGIGPAPDTSTRPRPPSTSSARPCNRSTTTSNDAPPMP
jgi:YD repeat-containing protein